MAIRQRMRVALYQPEIAGNVGTILRLAACLGAGVDLIEPMGFPWAHKARRRSAMDYEEQADIVRHADWDAFARAIPARLILFTTRGGTPLPAASFARGDTLLFGSESAGVPESVHNHADLTVRIPLKPQLRSLNLAVAAGIGLAEALRQTNGWPE